MLKTEAVVGITGRTLKEVRVSGGVIVIHNCGPAKVFVRVEWKSNLVPSHGFEPRLTDSKSAVLPLDEEGS